MIQLVFIFTLFSFVLCNQGCTDIKDLCKENVKFWLATIRDSNGQWIAETGLEHVKNSSVGWKVQVDGDSTDCDGEHYCRMVATLSANCKIQSISKPPSITTPKPPNCDDGYKRFATGRYKLHVEFKTWDEAKAICVSEGGYLAVVNTQAEADVLKQVFQPQIATWAFLGFSDREKEGVFVDIFGHPLPKLKWLQGQPDNYKGIENCGSLHYGTGTLNDLPCEAKTSFICEKPL